jgi:hypothetical protein
MRLSIPGPACPDCTRRSHAFTEEPSALNSDGTVRVPMEPSWWQDMQPPPLLIMASHIAWFLMFGEMPLPVGPVPGNSLFAGGRSSENQ